MQRTVLGLVVLLFGAFSAWVVWRVGLMALFTDNLSHPAGQQVFIDLCIALTLTMVWMWRDARNHGRKAWPWLVLTLAAGSFGPLLYLLTSKDQARVS